jgi:outer membrane assembly lipoprotein YfiO
MTRWFVLLGVSVATVATACGGRNTDSLTPTPARSVSPAMVDSLWHQAEWAVRHGKWGDAIKRLERLVLELTPEDPRFSKARYYLGEAHLGRGDHLLAAREFRKAADDAPDHPLAPDALLRVGDVYSEMWRRPELDPTHGQTALTTYQELLNRYPGTPAAGRAQLRIADLNERFAYKAYRSALFYFRLKAYDSAILYLKDLVASYKESSIAPDAVVKLIEAYEKLGYREDVREMCEYLRTYHPGTPQIGAACPAIPSAPTPPAQTPADTATTP